MKLKLTPEGHAVVKNGMPVYVHSNGAEEPFDVAGTMAALNRRYFETSKFVTERLSVPVDLALATFGSSFKVEDGRFVAHDQHGMKLYSYTRPGEAADFDEAMERLVSQYPDKEKILRPAGDPGSKPQPPGAGGGGAAQKALGKMGDTRAERVEYLAKRFPELP